MSCLDWENIMHHYRKLTESTYFEGRSPHHTKAAIEAVQSLCKDIQFDFVVELGCGFAPILDEMKKMGKQTYGVTLGKETPDHECLQKDMHLTGLATGSFDMVVSRHSLEHSPIPLLLLMEMCRISRQYALIIVPTPTERMINWGNHYSVFEDNVWRKLFSIAGWQVLKFEEAKYLLNEYGNWDSEYRYLLKKL